jgi:hypothetical protein
MTFRSSGLDENTISRQAMACQRSQGRAFVSDAELTSLWPAGFPVELFSCELVRPFEKRCPDTERGRAGRVVYKVANKSFDTGAFEHEDHSVLREKDAVSPKAGECEPIRRSLGEDLSRSLARARQELGHDRYALIHVTVSYARRSGLPVEQARYNLSEHLARLALAVTRRSASIRSLRPNR